MKLCREGNVWSKMCMWVSDSSERGARSNVCVRSPRRHSGRWLRWLLVLGWKWGCCQGTQGSGMLWEVGWRSSAYLHECAQIPDATTSWIWFCPLAGKADVYSPHSTARLAAHMGASRSSTCFNALPSPANICINKYLIDEGNNTRRLYT